VVLLEHFIGYKFDLFWFKVVSRRTLLVGNVLLEMSLVILDLALQLLDVFSWLLCVGEKLHERMKDGLVLELKGVALAVGDVVQLSE
jgi:hypothetical protein